MKHAKVSELKARLSSYLAEVRKGDTLVVCDRSTPVPMEEEGFTICESAKPISELREIQPVKLRKKVDIIKILREIREIGDRLL